MTRQIALSAPPLGRDHTEAGLARLAPAPSEFDWREPDADAEGPPGPRIFGGKVRASAYPKNRAV